MHTCINVLKKNKKFSDSVDIVYASHIGIKEESIPSIMQAKEVVECIRLLPLGYRTVLNLYAIEGFTHAQIAESLKVTEGTSKSQLSKARKMLRELIKEQVAKKPAEVVQFKMDKSVANWGFSV